MFESKNSRVIVVSNRLPYTLRRAGDTWKTEKSAGGLATAMGPILRKTEGLWVGWPGESSGADDATDEDLFARMPADAWTIHVGENQTRARYRLPGPEQFCLLLHEFAAGQEAAASRQSA